MQNYLNPLAPTVNHRYELLDEIERNTSKLSADFNLDTVEVLKQKNTELEETNRFLEESKDELKQGRKWCECRLITCVRWGLLGSLISTFGLGIARLIYKHTLDPASQCQDAVVEILGDVETYSMFVFGVFSAAHEVLATIEDKKSRNILQASTIERFGEESYQRFLQALHQFKYERDQTHLKECIQSFDEMPKNRINEPLTKQKLIPQLLSMLPEDDEVHIKFNRLREDGRRIHLEIFASKPKLVHEDSINPFEGEKSTVSASRPALPIRSSHLNYQEGWSELEQELGTRFNSLECDGRIYRNNGTIEEVIPEMIAIPIEEQFSDNEFEI